MGEKRDFWGRLSAKLSLFHVKPQKQLQNRPKYAIIDFNVKMQQNKEISMEKITSILTKAVSDAFEACGYDRALGLVTVSDRMDLCQFQCNGSFAGAKIYKKAPFMIADDVAAKLREDNRFAKVEAVKPGFLNLTLTDDYLADYINQIAADEHLGVPQANKPETIVIDYGGPNVAKPLHIGHLRAAIIGEALKRIARATGRTVLGDVHFGDWGTPLGLVIAEYRERHPDWACFKEDFDPEKDAFPDIDEDELNEVYPFASAKSKQDDSFKETARRVTTQLQSRQPGIYDLWKKIMQVSIDSVKRNYKRLDVDFDLWYGESDADPFIPETIEILKEKGLLHESEGAMVVDVQEEGDKITIPPIIVIKSNNSVGYDTTDIATILQRQREYQPERIWYVVDKRQALHFEQVFRCAKKSGLVPGETELKHIGFGTMNGSDGKPFKTRDGGVMRLSDLIQASVDGAMEKLKDSEYVLGDKLEAARTIGVAALKFGDLSNQPSKDYVFDINKFLSFDGKTGTYLLYTVTRINSILRKAGIDYSEDVKITGLHSDIERELAINIALSGETYQKAFDETAPSVLCDNAYNLASLFSRFYHDNRILAEEDAAKRSDWLALSLLTRKIITKQLDMLAIGYVENM